MNKTSKATISKPRILAVHFADAAPIPNACQIYRTNMPFHELSVHGWAANWIYIEDIVKNWSRETLRTLSANDIFVIPRAWSPGEEHLNAIGSFVELARQLGIRTVYEVDDDLTNEARDFSDKGVYNAMTIASWCDAVTVTTEYLANLMRERTGRPTYVLPNMLAPATWKTPPHRRIVEEGTVTVGLSGSPTHEEDWRVLGEVMPRILRAHPEVRFLIGAYHPDYLQYLPRTSYLEPMDYIAYANYVKACDIVLCPVIPDDRFNLSKSPIKAVEGQGSARSVRGTIGGAAVIATDNPVYRLAVTHEETGLLVKHTPEAWYQALDRVLTDTALRERLQLQGFKRVWKKSDISTEWVRWARCYQQILERPPCTVPIPILA